MSRPLHLVGRRRVTGPYHGQLAGVDSNLRVEAHRDRVRRRPLLQSQLIYQSVVSEYPAGMTHPRPIATKTLTSLDWAGSHVLNGDLSDSVDDLKRQGDGSIAVLGSGVLVQALIDNDLVDEYRLFIHPLVLGAGKRLFRQTARPLPMRLVDCTPTTTGVLLLTYQPT